MIAAHFAAAMSLLQAAASDIPVHDTDASKVIGDPAKYPFLVLSGGTVRSFSESLGGCDDGAQGLLRVTHTALSPLAVRELLDISRPALQGVPLGIDGRHGWEFTLEDSQDVDIDRDVRLVGADVAAFPFFAVDIYRIGSTTYSSA